MSSFWNNQNKHHFELQNDLEPFEIRLLSGFAIQIILIEGAFNDIYLTSQPKPHFNNCRFVTVCKDGIIDLEAIGDLQTLYLKKYINVGCIRGYWSPIKPEL